MPTVPYTLMENVNHIFDQVGLYDIIIMYSDLV